MKIPIPREHGTWAMLYAPILCAAVSVGHVDARFFLFLLSTTAAFFLRDPLESWIRLRLFHSADSQRLSFLRNWSIGYSVLALIPAAALILVYRLWWMPLFAVVFCAMLALHMFWISRKSDRQVLAELTAVLAFSSSAPACRYAMTGDIDFVSLLLWVLNAMFFASSVFYVKMRVSRVAKKHRSPYATVLNCGYHFLLVAALAVFMTQGWIPWIVVLAYVPVLIRAFAGLLARGKLSLTRIGVSEVVFTVLFVSIMILSFH